MTDTLMLYSGAITLGALHAFEPGHGKTLIAAYMIGSRGKAWDGFILGAIVTFTHTFSVILLGIIAKLLSTSYSATELHNWLGLVSAAIIIVVGIWMLRQRLFGHSGHHHFHLFGKGHSHHDHVHSDHHQHDHLDHHSHNHRHDQHEHHPGDEPHQHPHPHSHSHAAHQPEQAKIASYSKWDLLLLGISGGIIPCPAAIATLLAAVAAGRIAQGLSITIFFSLGLGLVMMGIGVALSQAGRLTGKISENLEFGRRMGIASAVLIVFLGSYTMFHSVRNIWF
ncbi:MAG: sulfite exporter TauE/SafE family protein [Proteobacteria bacterium]|nr:sulfite exporter TauE/SafE family protein [Pseudomonadota bacterium]MBU1738989.1 sulfite exporter TauE/SafE family protein [Pseudomonadota bacterium]